MAQIIKHRRGSINTLKDVTANVGELVMGTGSIGDLTAPVLFVGSTDTAAGGYKPASKIYNGQTAPILGSSFGSVMDGTPFYSELSQSLYILDHNGNINMDLTGNIEGNTISGVTINKLESTNVTSSYFTGSFVGDGSKITNISLTGITGLQLDKITSGTATASISEANGLSVNVNTSISGSLTVTQNTNTKGSLYVTGTTTLYSSTTINAGLTVTGTTDVNGALNVTGVTTLYDATTINSDLTVTGNTNTNGTLNVTGVTTLYDATTINAGLTVTGTTDVNGALNVTGETTLYSATTINDKLTVTGRTNADGGLNVTGSVNISGATSVTGALKVTENATFEKDLYVSGNIYQTGSFYTQGSVVLSGSINIGDFTGDTINFGGEVNSNILPTTGATYDLGSSGQTWNNIWGEFAHFTNIAIGDITLNSLSLPGDLIVSGSTTLSGSVYVKNLTEKRLVVAGVDGILTDYSGLTFNNGNLNVSGAIEVTNIQGTGSLYLKPDSGDARYFEIYNTGASDTHIKASGGLTFLGDDTNYVKIDDYLQKVTVNGVNGVILNTHASIYSGLTVTGSVNVNGNTSMTGSLIVSNASGVFDSSLIVSNSDLTLDGGSNIQMNDGAHLYFDTCVDMYYDSGTDNFVFYNDCNGFSFEQAVSVTGSLNVNGNVYINNGDTLYTNNIYNNGGDLHILTITGSTYIDSDTYTSIGWNDESNYTYYNSGGTYNEAIYIESKVSNNSGEYNFTKVKNDGVYLETQHHNGTGATIHDVWLDNTGSLNLLNVNLKTDGDIQVKGNTSITGSLNVSGTTTMSGSVTMNSDLYVSGNVYVYGTGTTVNLESHEVNIGDNIILVNAYSPFQRYAGISGYDSGSMGNSGSLLWDSQNNYWNSVDGSNMSSKLIGTTVAALGSEVSLTTNTLPKATSGNTIGDSLITENGTVFSYNTNKFTVTGDTGDTYIAGNFTIAGVGSTDNGSYGSYIVFRNSDNTLGFVDSEYTTVETNGLLGYKESDGTLVFSDLIDGGTY
jgi:hypothetical protein